MASHDDQLVHEVALIGAALGAGLLGGPVHPVSAVLITLGAALVVYRLASRPPPTYGGAIFDTPFAALPVDLIRQLLRGPALIAVLVAVHLLLAT